jgi:membrane protein
LGTERLRDAIGRASGRVDALEQRPLLGFPIASYRRFKEIDGKQLAFVIGGNLFISVIPLLIVGYAILEAFNPNRSIAVVVIQRFHLSGETAAIVRQTFTNARSGRNVALSLSIVSLLVTGFGVATTLQTAFARAFRVAPLRGADKFLRGAAWLVLMLTVTAVAITLRYWAQSRPWWFLFMTLPLLVAADFAFFLWTPRLLLHLPFQWHHLVPGAGICVIANGIISAVSALLMRRWLSAYGHAYGGFGVALAFLAWIGVLAAFWVWIAATAAIYWERFAGAARVAEIEGMSRPPPARDGARDLLSPTRREALVESARTQHPDHEQGRQQQDEAASE